MPFSTDCSASLHQYGLALGHRLSVELAFASPAFIATTCAIYLYVIGLILVRNVKALAALRPADRTIRTCLMAAAASALLATYSSLCLKVLATAMRLLGEGHSDVWSSTAVYVGIVGLATSAPTLLQAVRRPLRA